MILLFSLQMKEQVTLVISEDLANSVHLQNKILIRVVMHI